MKPRFRAEWVVVSEELFFLASCLLRPMSRNSVLEELSVRRFAVPIYTNNLSRTVSLQQIHIMTTALCRSCCTEHQPNCSSHESSHTVATTCRGAAQRHSDLSVCLSVCPKITSVGRQGQWRRAARPASGRMCHAVVRGTFPPSRRQVVTPPDPTRRSIAARQ